MFVQSMKFIETHSERNDNVSIGYLRQRLAGVVALRVHHGPFSLSNWGRKIWWMTRVHSLLDSEIN